MSQAYERFAKGRAAGKKQPQKYVHKVSFDDSVDSSRSDIPNFFIGDKSEAEIPTLPMREKEKKREPPIVRQESIQELRPKRVVSPVNPPKKREEVSSVNRSQDQVEESEQQEEIPEPEVQMEPHTSLSLFQIMKLYLGEYLFRDPFPLKKAIYINNNNEQENEINKKEFQVKFKNDQKEVSHFDNSITVAGSLLAFALILRNVFSYFYIYAWIAIIVLQFVAERTFLYAPIQYGAQKKGLIVLVVVAIGLQLVADWLSVRKRRAWDENRSSYKVYHHNGRMAEWVNIKAQLIKPGHLYKVAPGEYAPTDCVLIHCEHSLVQVQERHIISCLVESPSEIVLKETLLKGESVNLPLSGSLTYEISNPEYSNFQIIGKLNLEEPSEVSHPIGMSQIILRGSINCGDAEILCMAMETGIDSLLMKNLQYPFQHRKVYEESAQIRSKIISDDLTQDIKQRQITLLGVPLEQRFESAVVVFIFVFLLLSGVGVVANFFYRLTTPNEYYLATAAIPVINIVVYHLTNFIIFIPVLLIPIFKLFILMSGSVAQANISRRPIDLIPDGDRSRRTGSFEASRNEELLDNKKIIFPVQIKDHNLLHQLCSVDTIITTIDTFREDSAFTLHSIKVKGISHNFATTSLDSELYSTETVEDMRTFMSSAVLTTCKNEPNTSFHFDEGIEFAAKKYLDLKKVKNAYGEYLININDQFKVKHLFTIRATAQYPYQVVFHEPVGGDMDENPEVLVLIRGDTKTILDKTYGKEIELTVQSRKLHQEKDYYVQLLAKTAIKFTDAQQIQRAYNSNSIQKTFFYRNLDKFISRVQPMGLLIFNNNFFQKKMGQNLRNPLLNKSLITQYRPQKNQAYEADVLASHHLPNLVILAPVSKSSQPEFESIHTIKSLLTNSSLFNFALSEVGDKILHEKPSNLEKMMEQLKSERVLVWNGWDQKDVTYTVDILRKYGQNVLLYLQKDEYMYLMKECDCAVKGSSRLGYDSHKYSDISLSSRSSISFFYLTQLIRYDAIVIKQGLLSLFLTQAAKLVFYFVIEFINLLYTRGTGLAVIRTPFYLVVEVVLFFDIFYYLNWKDSMRAETFNKGQYFSTELLIRMGHALLQGVFITFITLYSLDSPPDSTGTTHSYHFPYFIIVFTFLHILIFQKLFNVLTSSFSVYKGLVIIVQILVLYGGFILVSLLDTYDYNGILWSALVGKSFITAVCSIWIGLTLPAIRLLLQLMTKSKKLRRGDQAKKTF